MQRITRPAHHINLMFVLALLPGLILATFFIGKASASPLDNYCERQFNQSFIYKISPLAHTKCESRFQKITNEWKTGLYSNK